MASKGCSSAIVHGQRWIPGAVLSLLAVGCSAGEPPGPREEVGTAAQGVTKAVDPNANGDTDFCNAPAAPCAVGEGDCDSNAQCETGLICGKDNGLNFGMGATHDVCVPSTCTNGVLDPGETTVDCGADCGDQGPSCTAPVCPNNGEPSTCTAACRCAAGWGDCDSDAQ
ncbi:MAG: hypothetical protein JW940_13345, partial [Polyangiaceae bacterium]|nr:hypothetical protein [Polyangiaceae bacterium]